MSRRNVYNPELLREYMRTGNARYMPAPMQDPISGYFGVGIPGHSLLDAFSGMDPDFYPTEFQYVDMSSEDNDDDYEYGSQNNRYCGFNPNFLDRRLPKQVPPMSFKSNKRITPEEAAKNAKELLDEEEKLKKKAEKKKQKKMRQRERRRLEKLEKENTHEDMNKQVDPGPVKPKPTEKDCEKNKANNTHVPPDPGQQHCLSAESVDSDDEEDDDDDESLVTDLEELDMSSSFVNNAASIAKRKLEQKPKVERKDKKPETSRKRNTQKRSTPEHQIKNDNKAEDPVEESTTDFVTRSTELAVLGNTYAERGNLETAVKYFTDAIKHNPKEFKLFGNRSYCYEKMQQYDKALIDADIALSMNPEWIKGLYRKGRALVGLKMYYEAAQTYKEVLKLDSSCTDAAQELMRVQIMQLMDMGFTREQSSNALIIHGAFEKALEVLSGIQGNMAAVPVPNEEHAEEDWECPQKKPPKVPLKTVPQNQPKASTAIMTSNVELFPIWVGDLVPALTEATVYELFKAVGPVHSVKVLQARHCAFVNYTNKDDCEKAIKTMHGYSIMGTKLVVRYPDKIATHLGVSKTASTDTGKMNKVPEECYFWRTTGCVKSNRCTFKHVPEHKGIDLGKTK